MGRAKANRCQFVECGKEIKNKATICSRHWLLIHKIKSMKGNSDKPISELIKLAREKELEIRQTRAVCFQGK